MIGITVFAAMAILLIGYVLMLYAGLLRAQQQVKQAWTWLEAALARRDGEIAQLLQLHGLQARAEQTVCVPVDRARAALISACTAQDAAALGAAERTLRCALTALCAATVNTRGMGEDKLLHALQFRLRALETAITAYQETYNEAARIQNARLEMFPDTLIATACHFARAPLIDFRANGSAVMLGLAFGK